MANEIQNHTGRWKTSARGYISKDANGDEKTDYSRWRLNFDEQGRQTWRYLESDEENKQIPQTSYDKYYLGLDTGLPKLPVAKTPLEATKNGLSFFSKLQGPSGQWASECAGPMFLLPTVVVAWYTTNTPIPPEYAIELKRYLFARQNPDGGWGWHVEGSSGNVGTTLSYVSLRLLGAESDDPRIVKARDFLHSLGGAVYGPSLSKFLLSVLGVMKWDCVNPLLPEFWLLPKDDPTAPWQWFAPTRANYLAMTYLWSKKFSYTLDDLTKEIRSEIYTEPYESVKFSAHRNSIAHTDNNFPKKWIVHFMNFLLVWLWIPIRWSSLVQRAEDRVWELIKAEDKNADDTSLNVVVNSLHLIACYIHDGEGSETVRVHRERILQFLWMKEDGMACSFVDGLQVWDTALSIHSIQAAGLANDPEYRPMLTKAHEFLEVHQLRENVENQEDWYRQHRKGGWAFNRTDQGHMISEVTGEALQSVLQLQELHNFPKLVSDQRIEDSVDCLLRMQNDTGGFGVYEKRRGSQKLEMLDSAEFVAKGLVSYDFVECTGPAVTALFWFTKFYPNHRSEEIKYAKNRGLEFIRKSQNKDGGWWGCWGICFTYGGLWALDALALNGEECNTSEICRRGCEFLLSKQKVDGGWGESYLSCEQQVYVHRKDSQVVQTAWACLALMAANYPDRQPITKGIKLIMSRQQPNGEWLQEDLEGSIGSGVLSYLNYKFYFPIRALGKYVQMYSNSEL